ncbi:hypothetical protein [Bradyrhizobium algeriense]|uniref:hypothetical protein n=1 Tax=Bradyrhizobium algeriense TaxID=634784 RepID=UPI00167E3818|nr:hypothetical protein [Bradyrhizobium algeriense]
MRFHEDVGGRQAWNLDEVEHIKLSAFDIGEHQRRTGEFGKFGPEVIRMAEALQRKPGANAVQNSRPQQAGVMLQGTFEGRNLRPWHLPQEPDGVVPISRTDVDDARIVTRNHLTHNVMQLDLLRAEKITEQIPAGDRGQAQMHSPKRAGQHRVSSAMTDQGRSRIPAGHRKPAQQGSG